jgi:hypothetical protein
MKAVGRFKAHVAQSVEHILGKDEVTGSSPVMSSRIRVAQKTTAGAPGQADASLANSTPG